MKILIIGSGAREIVIIKKLLDDSKKINESISIFCLANSHNPYLIENNINYSLMCNYNLSNIIELNFMPEFVIIGPENPLYDGYSDYYENMKIPVLGPLKIYANIETSKNFCRTILHELTLDYLSPKYTLIPKNSSLKYTLEILNSFNGKIVLKRDGLHGGKGVYVQDDDFTSKFEVTKIIEESDEDILIEEKLIGEEFSLMTISDGCGNLCHFPPIQDYKRLNDGDKGPNTGGMGCVIDSNNMLPFLDINIVKYCENINANVIAHLENKYKNHNSNRYNIGYRGVLYGSFMKCSDDSIKIIEYNARFGDPESIIGLSLLQSNFYTMCKEISLGELSITNNIEFSQNAMMCVYMVPEGYPTNSQSNYDIYFDKSLSNINNCQVIYASINKEDNHYYTQTSRSLLVTCIQSTLKLCMNDIYTTLNKIHGNLYYRKDIGHKFLTNYENAGVSIEEGKNSIEAIKPYIKTTYNENVISKYGAFSGEFNHNESVLVASIDGVGTKSIFCEGLLGADAYINLGKDLINHSINDILVQGAYPLFFLDYFGASSLNITILKNAIKGMAELCKENNIVLLGGETAELPQVYADNMCDLVGCIIGYKDTKFFKNNIKKGDRILAFKSVSPHTNGYSLIRKITNTLDINSIPQTIKDVLLTPHKSYIEEIKYIVDKYGHDSINGMAHITGGGIVENIIRVVPENMDLNIDFKLIQSELPEWCKYLMDNGNIDFEEMTQVFNCGIGYVIITNESDVLLNDNNLNLTNIGFIE